MSPEFISLKRLEQLRQVIRPTTFISSKKINEMLGLEIIFVSETFQHTGSFKFRAAYNLVANTQAEMFIAASSGNFGQGLALACSMLRKQCLIVMPKNSAKNKIQACKNYGAIIDLIDPQIVSRSMRLEELAKTYPEAIISNAYDHPLIIEGNASLGLEIVESNLKADMIIAPIGGGGLCSGIICGIKKFANTNTPVYAAEPKLANDFSQSLKKGKVVCLTEESKTIADGARTLSVGQHNWEILKNGIEDVFEISEESIKEALRLAFFEANLKLETTGSLSLAAILENKNKYQNKTIFCIASGGNIDTELFTKLIQ